MEPYYADDDVILYHADFREFEGLGPAAAAVTSPPYNAGLAYDVHDDHLSQEAYEELAKEACEALQDSLWASDGRAWVNAGVAQLSVWLGAVGAAGFAGSTTICWDYGSPTAHTAWGSWCSPGAPHLRYGWEPVICAWAGNWRREAPEGLERWRDGLGNWPALCRNLWRISPGASSRSGHPAVMPLELASRAIRLSTWPGETVVDPFAGTGTTLVAAKQLGRRAVGVELSERYCELAARRLAQGTLGLCFEDPRHDAGEEFLARDIVEDIDEDIGGAGSKP